MLSDKWEKAPKNTSLERLIVTGLQTFVGWERNITNLIGRAEMPIQAGS